MVKLNKLLFVKCWFSWLANMPKINNLNLNFIRDKPKVYDEHLRDDLLQGQAIDLISVMGPGFISM